MAIAATARPAENWAGKLDTPKTISVASSA